MQIISRRDALLRDLSRYFTGEPCARGHISERYARSSQCLACIGGRPHDDDMRKRKDIRQQAITDRRLKYFTGQACRNGHVAERYTRSGACVECIHPSFLPIEREERDARLRARALMKHGRFELHPDDVELFTAIVFARALAQEPLLKLGDVVTRCKPARRNHPYAVHTLWIFDEDRIALIEQQNAMLAARQPVQAECTHKWEEIGGSAVRCLLCGVTS